MKTKPRPDAVSGTSGPGPVAIAIRNKLEGALDPSHLEVINESHLHNVPVGVERHFKLVIVSAAFSGLSPIARHRAIHRLLEDELAAEIHALSIAAFTGDEWRQKSGRVSASPQCRGGS